MADHLFDEGTKYRALKTALGVRPFSGPSGPLTVSDISRQVGAILVAKAQKCFIDQRGSDGRPWPARAVPNVYGIIADLHAGINPPARRFQARPAGMDNGFRGGLVGSIRAHLTSVDTVEVGVSGPAHEYADKINDGGETESEVIDEKVRSGLYKFLYGGEAGNAASVRRELRKDKSTRNFFAVVSLKQAKAEMRASLGFLFNKKFKGQRLHGKIPPRPFLTLTGSDVREIAETVGSIVTRVA